MTEAKDRRDVAHRQPLVVGGPDRLIPIGPQLLSRLRQFFLAAAVLIGKRRQDGASLRCFSLRA
jgi:hypothetical protein